MFVSKEELRDYFHQMLKHFLIPRKYLLQILGHKGISVEVFDCVYTNVEFENIDESLEEYNTMPE